MGTWYRDGTASVANGTKIVTGTLTVWGASVQAGNAISFDGGTKWYEIAALDATTPNVKLTLVDDFAETTVTDGAYAIQTFAVDRTPLAVRMISNQEALIASQTDVIETTGAPDPTISPGNISDKSIAFDATNKTYYRRVDGVWTGPFSLGGAAGWSPVFALASDGVRRVYEITDWVGGEGTKPDVNKYVGATGMVDAIGDGVDVRGPTGATGQGIQPNDSGPFTGRTAHDGEAAGYIYLSSDGDGSSITTACLFIKNSATSGDWSDATALGSAGGAASPPQGRLTLTSGVAVTTADVTGGTSIYYTPAGGLSVPLYDGTDTRMVSIGAELTLALDASSGHTGYHQSGKNFDLFIYNDAGTIRVGTGPAWSSDTTRGTGAGTTELELKNGFFVNKNSMTLRFGSASGNTVTAAADQALYVGTFRATADGQASDTKAKRLVFNAYNQSVRSLFITEAATTWTYSTGTWRQTNANTANMVEVLDGFGSLVAHVRAHVWGQSSTATFVTVQTGIGIDSSTVVSGVSGVGSWNSSLRQSLWCFYDGPPGLGYHQLRWLEVGAGVDTQTWRNNTGIISGLSGWIAG